MKKLPCFLLLILLISSCTENITFSEDESYQINKRENYDICVMTWNTFLLDTPGEYLAWVDPLLAINKPQCEGQDCIDRALLICEAIKEANPDVVNLQEVWVEEAADALADCLSEAGYTILQGEGDDGLMTATKLEVKSNFSIPLNHDNGWIDCALDFWGDKGFQVSQLELESGCSFNNVNLHLDAGDCDGDVEARIRNIIQINSFINNRKTNIPTLFGGDWNIDLNTEEVSSLVPLRSKLTYNLGLGTPVSTAGNFGVLDYFLYKGTENQFTNFTTETIKPCTTKVVSAVFQVMAVFHGNEILYGTYPTETQAYSAIESMDVKFSDAYVKYIPATTKLICFEDVSDHLPVQTCFTVECDNIDDTPTDNNEGSITCDTGNNTFCFPGYECINGRCCHMLTGECL